MARTKTDQHHWTSGRRRRRVIASVCVCGVAVGAFFVDPANLIDDPETAVEGTTRDTATVTVASLGEEFSADGELDYADRITLYYNDGTTSTGTSQAEDGGSRSTLPSDATAVGGLDGTTEGIVFTPLVTDTATCPEPPIDTTTTTSIIPPTTIDCGEPAPPRTTVPTPTTTTPQATTSTAVAPATTAPTPTTEAAPPVASSTPGQPTGPITRGLPTGRDGGGPSSGAVTTGGDVEVQPSLVVNEIAKVDDHYANGDVLWRVNDEPTVVLLGDLPAYRRLEEGDEGPDVAQLKSNLVELGYDPDGFVTIDDTYTGATSAMVERWQNDLGIDDTGEVALDRVVFVPHTGRISSVAVAIGDAVSGGTSMLTVSSRTRQVEFPLAATDRHSLSPGDIVTVRLPDRATFEAKVTGLVDRSDGTSTVSATPTWRVDYPVDVVPVSIDWSVGGGAESTVVPATAILRTDTRNYFVEVVANDGISTMLVEVTVGDTSGGLVTVTGDLTEGDTVISP
ncbi:MAG: peptidoglycan-binding protein [Acidobacteria bacterium]|nr:peptidoglycan-binding protein [Acidobacteriota bacterium]